MSNVTITTTLGIVATDITAQVNPFNRNLAGVQLAVTAWSASDFFQVATTATTIPLPATTVWYVYVRNLGTNNITLNYTPTGGGSDSIVLLPVNGSGLGGVFLYLNTTEAGGGGIVGLTATATTGATPIEYFLAS